MPRPGPSKGASLRGMHLAGTTGVIGGGVELIEHAVQPHQSCVAPVPLRAPRSSESLQRLTDSTVLSTFVCRFPPTGCGGSHAC
jgi:hypothetical protein